MKAMILAAGQGSRLKPLTDSTPKPLLQVGQYCLIEYHLFALKKAGVAEVVINVSYLANTIQQFLGDGSRYGLKIIFSVEPVVLGTGGGIKHALSFLGSEPFLLISADVWSDYTYSKTILDSETEIHLVLVNNPHYHAVGDYGLDQDKFITRQAPLFNYAGIAKIHPKIFTAIREEKFSFSPLINKAIEHHGVSGEMFNGTWFNVGTPHELAKLRAFLQTSTNFR